MTCLASRISNTERKRKIREKKGVNEIEQSGAGKEEMTGQELQEDQRE